MATIHDLQRSITEMEFHDALQIVKAIRNNRRVDKYVRKKKVAHKKKKAASRPRRKQPTLQEALKAMTKEQKAQFFKDLGG